MGGVTLVCISSKDQAKHELKYRSSRRWIDLLNLRTFRYNDVLD